MPRQFALCTATLLAVGLIVLSLSACGGRGLAPQPGSPSGGSGNRPGAGPRQKVFNVIMRPQEKVEFPDKAASWQAPAEVLKLLPPSHTASCDGSGWLLTGGMYQDALPLANISREGAESELGRYKPNWQPGDPFSGLAFGIYHWNLRGYSGSPTMKFTWDPAGTPADFANMYVGFANYGTDAWDWYEGPADMVLTVPSFGPYRDASGVMLMAVVMLGSQEVVLSTLEAGAPETRGTGADELPNPGVADFPVLGISGSLPGSVDLSDGCAPIGDQGSWGSCTAWASGDGAYNYELGMIYGTLGWDLTKPRFRVSPDYIYVKSGTLGGYLPGGDYGRWTNEVIDMLMTNGAASLEHVPYDLIYDPSFSPNGAEATADAQALRINKWQTVECSTLDGINNVKAILVLQRKVLPMQIYLDYSFFDYQAGQVWTPQDSNTVGGHAMCIVGYDDAKQAFKVRNSWGPYWGEDGYVWIGYEAFELPFTGALAFTLSDEYDPLVALRFGLQTGGWTPVTGVSATDGTTVGGVDVSWNKHFSADGYKLYRDDRTTPVETLAGGNSTSWTDSIAADGRGHIYWVQPLSGASSGPLSAPDTGFSSHAPQLLSVSPTQGTEGQEAVFTVSGFGSGPLTYSWNFGGGANPNTSTEARPTVILANAGLHQASVTVNSPLGSDTLDFELGVGGIPPVVNFVEGRSGFDGSAVTLKPDINGSVGSYSWNFGGGATPNTSTAAQPSVTLGAPGLYEASLVVISGAGSDTYNFYLSVLDSTATDWPIFGHDGRGSGQSPVTGPQTNNVKWKFFAGLPGGATSNRILNPLLLPGGDLIVVCNGGTHGETLRRLNPDGTADWGRVYNEQDWFFSQPWLYSSGTKLLLAENADIVALNAATGAELWRFSAPAGLSLIPLAMAPDGSKVYTLASGRDLYVVDAATGAQIAGPFMLSDTYNKVSAQAVIAPNGTLFIGSKLGYDWQLITFDTQSDVPGDRIYVPARIKGMALSADGITLFTTDDSSWVRAYDIDTCKQLWFTNDTAGPFSNNNNMPRVLTDGTVIAVNNADHVFMLHPESGAVLWDYDLAIDNDCFSSPAIGLDGTVYVGGGNKKLYAIRDGSLVWESADVSTWYFNGDPSLGSDGTLYCGDDSGWLWAFGPGSGEERVPALIGEIAPLSGDSGDLLTLDAAEVGTAPISYAWDFGGGASPNTSTLSDPQVTLGPEGSYQCSLSISNLYGNDTRQFTLTVNAAQTGPHWEHYELHNFGSGLTLFASGAMVGGKPAVAVGDTNSGDLAYIYSNVANPTQLSDWQTEIVDTTHNINDRPALLDVGGEAQIAFYASDGIWYCRRNGANWTQHAVQASGVQIGCDLALVNGLPAIAFCDEQGGQYKLGYARASSSAPAATGDWTICTVGTVTDLRRNVALADAGGYAQIVFSKVDSGANKLAFARATTTAPAGSGDWAWHLVDPGVGWVERSDILVSGGQPLIAVSDSSGPSNLRLYNSSTATPSTDADWQLHYVDTQTYMDMVNFLTLGGLPVIGHMGGGGWNYMRLARAGSTEPSAPGDWSIEPVEKAYDLLYAFDNGGQPALLAENGNNDHLEYWYFVP